MDEKIKEGAVNQGINNNNLDQIFRLYETYSQNHRSYNSIVWQFPTALITLNIVILNEFFDKPVILFPIALLNFVLIQVLYKMFSYQRKILELITAIEEELKMHDFIFRKIIPDFSFDDNKVLKPKSGTLICGTLFILNTIYLVVIALNLILSIFSICNIFLKTVKLINVFAPDNISSCEVNCNKFSNKKAPETLRELILFCK